MIPRDIMNIQSAILQSTCSTNRQCALESNIPHLGPPAIHQIIPLHSSHGSSIEVQFQGTKYKWIYHHTYTMCIYPYIYIILWSPIYNYIYMYSCIPSRGGLHTMGLLRCHGMVFFQPKSTKWAMVFPLGHPSHPHTSFQHQIPQERLLEASLRPHS